MAKRQEMSDGRDGSRPSSGGQTPSLGLVGAASTPGPLYPADEDRELKYTSALTSPDGAESVDVVASDEESLDKSEGDTLECAICLQTCMHPVQLPCSHIFCFLCVKGVAIQSKRCALCRQDIPVDFFNNPALLRREQLFNESVFEGCYQWYYQGNNGWWQYDERASAEIEEFYKEGSGHLEILIAGFLYVIDFENMMQFRRNDPSRRRKIKRDLISIPDRKGVAGLKVQSRSPDPVPPHRMDGDGGENVPCVVQPKQSKRKPKPNTTARTDDTSTNQSMTSQIAAARATTSPTHSSSRAQRTSARPNTRTPRASGSGPRVPHNTPEGLAQTAETASKNLDNTAPPDGDSLSSRMSGLSLNNASGLQSATTTQAGKASDTSARRAPATRAGCTVGAETQLDSSSDEGEWQ